MPGKVPHLLWHLVRLSNSEGADDYSDVQEWINEIPIVPVYYLEKPQPREKAWQNQ